MPFNLRKIRLYAPFLRRLEVQVGWEIASWEGHCPHLGELNLCQIILCHVEEECPYTTGTE